MIEEKNGRSDGLELTQTSTHTWLRDRRCKSFTLQPDSPNGKHTSAHLISYELRPDIRRYITRPATGTNRTSVWATESRICTLIVAASHPPTHTHTSIQTRRELGCSTVACDVVVVALSCGTAAAEMLCRHMHRQARSASLPC